MQSSKNCPGLQIEGSGVLAVRRGCLTFGRRTASCFYVRGCYFLDGECYTDGGHEHGLIALWEIPIVGVAHSSNKYNHKQASKSSYNLLIMYDWRMLHPDIRHLIPYHIGLHRESSLIRMEWR